MVNVALSGSLDGGLASGLTVLAGPSKHFKTSFAWSFTLTLVQTLVTIPFFIKKHFFRLLPQVQTRSLGM